MPNASKVIEHATRLLAGLSLMVAAAGVGAANLQASVTAEDGSPLADAVVIALPLDRTDDATTVAAVDAAINANPIVDQINKEFVPFVTPIIVGSSVRFPNKDQIRHQVYSFSAANRFELPLYTGTPAEPVLFDTPGVVTLGCNIHDWMLAYVYVAETPWFAKSGADGKASITNIPAGRYRVRIWHPNLDGTEEGTARDVTVGDAAAPETWHLKLKKILRPRRAPVPGQTDY